MEHEINKNEEIPEKFVREIEMEAKRGNLFAKRMVGSWEKDERQQILKIGGDWFEMLIGIVVVIAIFAISGVIILAIIKWAFATVFGS